VRKVIGVWVKDLTYILIEGKYNEDILSWGQTYFPWGHNYHAHNGELILRVLDYIVIILVGVYLVLWLL
jgi:hypothetical protein